MKILILGITLRTGGQEKIALELASSLAVEDDMDVFFLTLGNNDVKLERKIEELGCNVIRSKLTHKYSYYQLYKIIKNINNKYGKFDVVHVHGVLRNGIYISICKFLKIPIRISHCHSTNHGRTNNVFTTIYEFVTKFLIKRYSNVFLSCGQEAGDYLYGKDFFSKHGTIIYNGVDVNMYKPNVIDRNNYRKKFFCDKDTLLIGEIAHLIPIKNQMLLLDIFNEIVSMRNNCKLLFIGDGSDKGKIQDKINSLNLNDKVTILGNRDDIPQLLNALDIVVLPSLYEGVPLSLVEAQCNGALCFASTNISKEIKITDNLHFIDFNVLNKNECARIMLETKSENRLKCYNQVCYSNFNLDKSTQLLKKIIRSMYEN